MSIHQHKYISICSIYSFSFFHGVVWRWETEISRYGVYYIYHKMEGKIEVVEEKRYPNKKVASKKQQQQDTKSSACR
jgi:hypothetical protein